MNDLEYYKNILMNKQSLFCLDRQTFYMYNLLLKKKILLQID